MSQMGTIKRVFRALGLILVATGIAMSFNNCGQIEMNFAKRAFFSSLSLQEEMHQLYSGHVDPSICRESDQYHCTRRIYSEDATDGQADVSFPCETLRDGTSICVNGTELRFNTTAAAQDCAQRPGCTENFEYEEFHCYHGLANAQGAYPIEATEPLYAEALQSTFNACHYVVEP